jgi:hypothetical protein
MTFINEQPITPESYFKQKLDPISFDLANYGAHHVMIGWLPDHNGMHICSSAPRPSKEYIQRLERIVTILEQHIAECKSQPGASLYR